MGAAPEHPPESVLRSPSTWSTVLRASSFATLVPRIGIIAACEREMTRLNIDGIAIVRALPRSPAANAGLEGVDANGDAVTT
jgi:hypothetical protein